MEYVYVLRSEKDGKLYTGWTNNLRKRFWEHNQGKLRSTKGRIPLRLVYYEACMNREDAKKKRKIFENILGKKIHQESLEQMSNGVS